MIYDLFNAMTGNLYEYLSGCLSVKLFFNGSIKKHNTCNESSNKNNSNYYFYCCLYPAAAIGSTTWTRTSTRTSNGDQAEA